jgi:hypothetical protein
VHWATSVLGLSVADGAHETGRERQRAWLVAAIREFVDGFFEQLEDQSSQQQTQQQQKGGSAVASSGTGEATAPPDIVVARVCRLSLRLTADVHPYAPMDELGTQRQVAARALARVALLARGGGPASPGAHTAGACHPATDRSS